nr:MAG TPA: hypothetical protein [Caudoviricetes sp.]
MYSYKDILSSILYRQQVRPLYCLSCIKLISTSHTSYGGIYVFQRPAV